MVTKRQIAGMFQRFPWLQRGLVWGYRLLQARFTAGTNGILLNSQGQILLVEHVYHGQHSWGLPGGWVERQEEPAETLVREFQEELGIQVRVVRPIFVQKAQFWGGHLDISYLVEQVDTRQEMILSNELMDHKWFVLEDLPSITRFDRRAITAWQTQQKDMGT